MKIISTNESLEMFAKRVSGVSGRKDFAKWNSANLIEAQAAIPHAFNANRTLSSSAHYCEWLDAKYAA